MELQKACCGFGHREVYQNITGQLERAVLEAAERGCTLQAVFDEGDQRKRRVFVYALRRYYHSDGACGRSLQAGYHEKKPLDHLTIRCGNYLYDQKLRRSVFRSQLRQETEKRDREDTSLKRPYFSRNAQTRSLMIITNIPFLLPERLLNSAFFRAKALHIRHNKIKRARGYFLCVRSISGGQNEISNSRKTVRRALAG